MRLNWSRSSRHIFAASTLAPDSTLGSASIEITDNNIFSTDCTGLQRSEEHSYPIGSSPETEYHKSSLRHLKNLSSLLFFPIFTIAGSFIRFDSRSDHNCDSFSRKSNFKYYFVSRLGRASKGSDPGNLGARVPITAAAFRH